jgi:hypothetical protein
MLFRPKFNFTFKGEGFWQELYKLRQDLSNLFVALKDEAELNLLNFARKIC